MKDLVPGFRFYPTEEELVSFYLQHCKIEGKRPDLNLAMDRIIPELDIYDFRPWDLPQLAGEASRGDLEQWFFFIPMQEREARGGRPNRLTDSGYWKATGAPGYVYSSGNHRIIGVKRTMVFYEGRAPAGRKTVWKMNEYKAIEGEASSSSSNAPPKLRHEFSLCRVYKKSKTLRAFDRRPSAGLTGCSGAEAAVAAAVANQQTHGSDLHQGVAVTPECSFSGDQNAHPSSTGNPSEMEVEDEPVWDWEQLNWF